MAIQGRYDDAEVLKNKIEQLKKQIAKKKKKELNYQHSSEMENLENSYKKEIEEFHSEWDMKFKEFEDRSKAMEDTLNQKHSKEMEELYTFLEQKLPKNVKFSREYLELKNQEETLVKQQRFKEASLIKKKAENLEKVDTETWNKAKTEKIKSQSVKTAHQHLIEKNALKKKIEIEFDVMKKQRQSGLEQINHKYKNRKFDLEMQQKQEKLLNENNNVMKASKEIFFKFFRNYYK